MLRAHQGLGEKYHFLEHFFGTQHTSSTTASRCHRLGESDEHFLGVFNFLDFLGDF